MSRRGDAVCTRPAGHAGLHHRTGTGLMWSDAQADPPGCPAGGRPARPAPMLADGFPNGRALCEVCLAFVRIDEGRLVAHDTWRGGDDGDTGRRRDWFNTFGW
jgi:hypothetical protein